MSAERQTEREIRNPGTKSTVSFSEPHAMGTPPAMYQKEESIALLVDVGLHKRL